MKKSMVFLAGIAFCMAIFADEPAKVDPLAGDPVGERIYLWPKGQVPEMEEHQYNEPFIEWFTPSNKTTDAVMILSCGGGYNRCAWTSEGSGSGLFKDWLLEKGLTVVRLHYRTGRSKKKAYFTAAWQDAQRAVRLVRAGAAKHGVNPDKIGFYGFSAAAHQALLMAVSSETKKYEGIDEIDSLPCNINYVVACFPAYVLRNPKYPKPNDEFKFEGTIPPVFLMHGDADHHTPMASIRMYEKLHAMKVPVEMHILATRGHDLWSKAEPGTPAAEWKEMIWRWLVQMKFCPIK